MTDDGVQIHQFGDARIRTTTPNGTPVEVLMRAEGYPFDGAISLAVSSDDEIEISVRIPAWATAGATVQHGDRDVEIVDGYARVRSRFDTSVPIEVHLPMAPRFVYPDPSIDALRDTVAIERGPLVLCAESPDLPPGVALDAIRVTGSRPIAATGRGAEAWFTISHRSFADWPYTASPVSATDDRRARLTLHPYFSWANRGPSTMRVFIPLSH
jgi:DUF1680 family protein